MQTPMSWYVSSRYPFPGIRTSGVQECDLMKPVSEVGPNKDDQRDCERLGKLASMLLFLRFPLKKKKLLHIRHEGAC
jgi:hypothetical protein